MVESFQQILMPETEHKKSGQLAAFFMLISFGCLFLCTYIRTAKHVTEADISEII